MRRNEEERKTGIKKTRKRNEEERKKSQKMTNKQFSVFLQHTSSVHATNSGKR